jgi:hypothetical protein
MSDRAALIEDIGYVRHRQNRELSRLGRAPSLAEQCDMAALAERYRPLYADLELSMPTPRSDATPLSYKAELLTKLKPYSQQFRHTDLARMANIPNALDGLERSILADAKRIASDPTIGSRNGGLRLLHRTDAAGAKIIEFAGDPRSWMSVFMPPVTMLEAFQDPMTGKRLQMR